MTEHELPSEEEPDHTAVLPRVEGLDLVLDANVLVGLHSPELRENLDVPTVGWDPS